MVSLRLLPPIALGIVAFLVAPSARAKPTFIYTEIEGPESVIFFCDLDGDHLKDAVLRDRLSLTIFYQHPKTGFVGRPPQRFRLDDQPAIVWPAKLGKNFDSLIVMTSDAVTELCFTNRTGPPDRRPIIKQRTIVPEKLYSPGAIHFPLAASAGADWPLLLVPTADGLQVWQHREAWRQVQLIDGAVDTQIRLSTTSPAYTRTMGLNLSLGDLNGDGRDDLIVRRSAVGDKETYALYLQKADGSFGSEPVLTYTNKLNWRTDLYWVDLNRDGKPDLIRSTALDEPFFVPAMRSGKVMVSVYLADERGRIPAEPQQVFRKNDWSPPLPMVDVDGDGFMDLVLGFVPLSTREGLRKAIIAEQIDLSLKFHFGRAVGGFPKEAETQRDLLLRFHHQFFFNSDRRLYYEQFVSLKGDFNGDGKKDLLVSDHGDDVSVYCFVSREKGFSAKPDFSFNCPESIDWWEVDDLNGDGVSDLIVKSGKRNAFRIFLSQGK